MGNTLNASSIGVVRRDGVRHNDPETWMQYVHINNKNFVNGLRLNGTSIYPERIASVLLLGLNIVDGKLVPVFYDIDIQTFINAVGGTDKSPAIPSAELAHDRRQMSTVYNQNVQIEGMNTNTTSLLKMNSAISSAPGIPYAGAMAQSTNLRKPSQQGCWGTTDRAYAGWTQSSPLETNGITELTFLFYMQDVMYYMAHRYGYRNPNDTGPYNALNWLKVSDNGLPSTSSRYYKIMFLTETDLYLHMDITSNPSLLTPEFANSPMFARMVESVATASEDILKVNGIGTPFHSQNMIVGQSIYAGQCIYSKDFKYKLHVHQNGDVFVWRLPITNASTPTHKYIASPISSRTANDAGYPCYLTLNAEGALVLVSTPLHSVVATMNNTNYAKLAKNYRATLTAGGAVVVTSSGYRDTPTPWGDKTDIYGLVGSDAANWKSTTNALDPNCVSGWLNIPDITKPSRAGPYQPINNNTCYSSPFVTQNVDTASIGQRFYESNMQLIVHSGGYGGLTEMQKTFGEAFNFIEGPLVAKAMEYGFKLTNGVDHLVRYAYCTRGDRLASDTKCASYINSFRDITPAWKKTIDDKSRFICETNYGEKYKKYCSVIKPIQTNATISALQRVNSEFQTLYHLNNEPGVFNPYSRNVGDIMANGKGYSVEGLDYIFNRLDPSYHKKWQELYALAAGVTPFPDYSGFTTLTRTTMFKHSAINSIVVTFLKTSAGMIGIVSKSEFPYTNKLTSIDKNDAIIKRMLVTGDIMANSKWEGPSFTFMTASDIHIFAGSAAKVLFGDSMDVLQIDIMSAGSKVGNGYVFYRTSNIDKAIGYIRATTPIGEELDRATYTLGTCATVPDACAPEALTYLKNNTFDKVSNNWCDLASAEFNRNTDITYLSTDNAKQLRQACDNSYALVHCPTPENRYKSGFTQRTVSHRNIFGTFSHSPKERYSGSTSCVDICDSAVPGTGLFTACKRGSIDYCKQGDNPISDICMKEAGRYSEIQTIVDNWCIGNPTHPKYATICKPTTATIAVTPVSTSVSAATIVEIPNNPLNELQSTHTYAVKGPLTGEVTMPPPAQKTAGEVHKALEETKLEDNIGTVIETKVPEVATVETKDSSTSVDIIAIIMYLIIFAFIGSMLIASFVNAGKSMPKWKQYLKLRHWSHR